MIINPGIFVIHKAKHDDKEPIERFLKENKLRPVITIDENSIYLFVLHDETIIGTMGAEIRQQYALIKSAGVAKQWRKKGIAQKLFQKLLDECKQKGIEHLYLFSRQAPEFWSKLGFNKCEVQQVINVLSDTNQIKEFIEDNSIWTDVAWYRPLFQI